MAMSMASLQDVQQQALNLFPSHLISPCARASRKGAMETQACCNAMATFELYRRSTIAMCLTKTLDEKVSSATLSSEPPSKCSSSSTSLRRRHWETK